MTATEGEGVTTAAEVLAKEWMRKGIYSDRDQDDALGEAQEYVDLLLAQVPADQDVVIRADGTLARLGLDSTSGCPGDCAHYRLVPLTGEP